jgi:hypothetical protein
MGFYVVPASSEGFNNFRYTVKGNGPEAMREGNTDVYRHGTKKRTKTLTTFFVTV